MYRFELIKEEREDVSEPEESKLDIQKLFN